MTRLAALLMFLSWLPFCVMPAVASTYPEPVAAGHHHAQGAAPAAAPGHHVDLEMAAAETAEVGAVGKGCPASFCAACLTLLPQPPEVVAVAASFSCPSDHSSCVITAGAPAPPEPPPRR
ncbi:hypothetical protein [Pseudorhizobium pelagicum]|uniref:Uncharacterized protein n=1 Tax=Pseudorhizobium pelagicum TaxID=1509405 RepID=A0A922P602_9HYPH|nr:hypothetical protein [Pseudorhizobium pelagicum]KEQ09299.1 hypothetical protein GV67_01070 [Pseudorhizobium pelagicum]KEQ10880.1 hypothetical protein GV68_00975 [Pseudorhizobium pelagicum]